MRDMTIRFSKWLGERKAKGQMTLEAMGRAVGSHKGYMSGILSEKVNPPARSICTKIAKLFKEHPDYVVFMAYRDKAPEPVQRRLEVLEILRNTTARYRAALLKPGGQLEARDLGATIDRTLDVLDKMWVSAQSTNGNGNGHKH